MTVHVVTGDDHVCRITLDRPEANALSIEMRDTIVDAVRGGRVDPNVRALLITGTADAFCAGMDLSASTVSQAGGEGFDTRSTSEALRVGVQSFVQELWELDKPTVAAVNGVASGRRPPRSRVRLRAGARAHPLHLVVRQVGARRRRRWGLPAPPARRSSSRQGDGDARRRCIGAEAVTRASRTAASEPASSRPRPTSSPARLAADRRARSGFRSDCSTPASRPISCTLSTSRAHISRSRRRLPISSRAWSRSRNVATPASPGGSHRRWRAVRFHGSRPLRRIDAVPQPRLAELDLDLPCDDVALSAAAGLAPGRVAGVRVPSTGGSSNRWRAGTQTRMGAPTELVTRRWVNFGRSGAGWIWGGEAVAVTEGGRANPRQLLLDDSTAAVDRTTADRARLRSRAASRAVPLVGLQLTHSGRWAHDRPRTAFAHRALDERAGIDDPDAVLDRRRDRRDRRGVRLAPHRSRRTRASTSST